MSQDDTNNILLESIAKEADAAKEAGAIGFMARVLTQATLPHSKIDQPTFTRKNGDLSLAMMAHPDVGLPYGSIPRLLLSWMTTEAVRTKSPALELGASLSAFMSQLDLTPTGGRWGSITRLREQTKRLFSTSISCIYDTNKQTEIRNIQIVESASLWWNPKSPEQMPLWKSTVTLGNSFFNEITDRPVPVDMLALKALKRSPMALDIYCWLTYRMSYLNKDTEIPWPLLQMQFGADYAQNEHGLRNFKMKFLKHLKSVIALYPEAGTAEGRHGLILLPSKPHVARLAPPKLPRLKTSLSHQTKQPQTFLDTLPTKPRIFLKPETYEEARKVAPRMDIYALERDWLDWHEKSGKENPNNPDGAFIGFCKLKGGGKKT